MFKRVDDNEVLTEQQRGLTENATLHSAHICTTHDTVTYEFNYTPVKNDEVESQDNFGIQQRQQALISYPFLTENAIDVKFRNALA